MSQFHDVTSDARTLLSAALARFPDLDNPDTLPYRDDTLAMSLKRYPEVWLTHPSRLLTLAATSAATDKGYTNTVTLGLIAVVRNPDAPGPLRDAVLAQVIRSHITPNTDSVNLDSTLWSALRDYDTLPAVIEDALLALPPTTINHALTNGYLAVTGLSEPATQTLLNRNDPKMLTPLARSPHPEILRQITPRVLKSHDGRALNHLIANKHLPIDCLIDIATPAITGVGDIERMFSITSHALRDSRPELTVIPDFAVQHLTDYLSSGSPIVIQLRQGRYHLDSLLVALLTTRHAPTVWNLAHSSTLTAAQWTPNINFYRAATVSSHLPTDIRLTAADHLTTWFKQEGDSHAGVGVARDLLRESTAPAALIDRVLTVLRDAKAAPATLELIQHPNLTADQISGYAKGGSRLARAARERLNPTVATAPTATATPMAASVRPPDSLRDLATRLTSDTITDLTSVVATLSGFLNGTAPLSDRRAAALALTEIVNAHPYLAASIPAPALAACAKFRDRLPLSSTVLEVLTETGTPEAARLVSRSVMQSMNLLSA